jgi:NADH-quinone oxidoreductase subunit N
MFGRYYIVDYYTTTSKAAVVVLFIVFIIMLTNFEYRILATTVKDFILIILLSLLFCFLIISTFDLFMLYLCFEGLSLLTIVIIAYHHLSRLAVEAALKYFCLNAMSSCAFLFSLVFIHNAVGYTNFVSVKNFLNLIVETEGLHPTPGLKVGVVLLLIGFLFKFAVFPFGM